MASSSGALATAIGARLIGRPDVAITDVVHDSREASPGSLFVAIRGLRSDGHDYVRLAAERGASALCVERPLDDCSLPQLVVDDTRWILGELAAIVWDRPSERLQLIGVTGTNGKTTVTYLLESIGRAAGRITGVIGTTGIRIGDRQIEAVHTTPEASDLQRLLAMMVTEGADLVAAEISSHALALGRAEALHFEVAGFTNLTQDHLDFHRDMEDYFLAKRRLFEDGRSERAVIWMGDAYGRRLASETHIPVIRVGVDVTAADAQLTATGARFRLVTPDATRAVRLPLPGAFNIENALIAAGCALAVGLPLDSIAEGLGRVQPVPGRFEGVDAGQPFGVIVDYAHTPDGVETVIKAARGFTDGRVIAVLGAGGDRDRSKRPAMGAAASAADLFIITSDNPRSEDPIAIIEDIRSGVPTDRPVAVDVDRRTAIRTALHEASPGDTVLILGKGHERGQEISGRIHEFDDRVVARTELEAMGAPCSPC